jgi:hypothetical protein
VSTVCTAVAAISLAVGFGAAGVAGVVFADVVAVFADVVAVLSDAAAVLAGAAAVLADVDVVLAGVDVVDDVVAVGAPSLALAWLEVVTAP